MGASVGNIRSFPRYSRTETKTFVCQEAYTIYDFFQVTSDCLIRLSGGNPGGSRTYGVYVNDETTATMFSESTSTFAPARGSRYVLNPGGRAGQVEMQPYELILLLQKGDMIKLSTYAGGAGYSHKWTIDIYE